MVIAGQAQVLYYTHNVTLHRVTTLTGPHQLHSLFVGQKEVENSTIRRW